MAGNGNEQTVGINIKLGVDGTSSVDEAKKQIQDLNSNINKTGKVDVAGNVKTLRQELKGAINDVGKLAAQGKQNTQEYIEAARRVADLRNQQDELNNSLKAFDPDNKFRVAANAAAAGTRAIGGYTASLTLLGIESDDAAKTLAKLQAISSLADSIDGVLDLADSFKDLGRMIGIGVVQTEAKSTATAVDTTATVANTVSVEANTVANQANAVATGGATTATEAATVATNGFGVALKAIGIGVIIAALVALYYNFDKVKKFIEATFPALGSLDTLFDRIIQTVYGVGAAVKKVFSGLGKVLEDVFTGNFSKIGEDLKGAFDVSDAFRKGVSNKIKADANDAKVERIKKEIETNERIIKERKSLGEDTYKLEVKNQKLKIATLDKDDKDYKKNKANAESDLTILINGEEKKRSDKAKEIAKAKADKEAADRKTALEAIKANNEAALKIIAEGSQNERKVALTDIDIKYKKEFELLQKRKQDIKDFNTEFNNLTAARKIEESKINKKYDDEINDYLKSVQVDTVSSYDKTINEINKTIDEKLKNASPELTKALNQSRTDQTNKLRNLESLDNASQSANIDLTNVETANRPNETDTPEQATQKINNLAAAKLNAENAAFELKKVQLEGQNLALQQLNADHESKITEINDSNAQERKRISQEEFEAKKAIQSAELDLAGNVGTLLQNIAGKNKALAISGIVLEQASAIGKIVMNTQVANAKAVAASPLTLGQPWVAINTISGALGAAASIAAGAKAIAAIKSGTASSGGGSGGMGTPTAPVINSTVLKQSENGSQDVVNAVKTSKQEPIRAFIVDKDLNKQANKNKLIDSLSKV